MEKAEIYGAGTMTPQQVEEKIIQMDHESTKTRKKGRD
jgi:hypothetical protein